MSIASKAKSSYQLCNPSNDKVESCPTRRWHGCGGDGDDDNCMTKKWVPLEDAQNEIEKWKHSWNQEAVKIENALEILNDGSLWHWADADTRKRLRSALNNSKPSSEAKQ